MKTNIVLLYHTARAYSTFIGSEIQIGAAIQTSNVKSHVLAFWAFDGKAARAASPIFQ